MGQPKHSLISSTFQPTIDRQRPASPEHTAVSKTPPSFKETHSAFQQFFPIFEFNSVSPQSVFHDVKGEKTQKPLQRGSQRRP